MKKKHARRIRELMAKRPICEEFEDLYLNEDGEFLVTRTDTGGWADILSTYKIVKNNLIHLGDIVATKKAIEED